MIAAVLRKGAKLRLTRKMRENGFATFHGGIIALLCCGFLLQGCGYKTKPVYLGCSIAPPEVVADNKEEAKDSIEKV